MRFDWGVAFVAMCLCAAPKAWAGGNDCNLGGLSSRDVVSAGWPGGPEPVEAVSPVDFKFTSPWPLNLRHEFVQGQHYKLTGLVRNKDGEKLYVLVIPHRNATRLALVRADGTLCNRVVNPEAPPNWVPTDYVASTDAKLTLSRPVDLRLLAAAEATLESDRKLQEAKQRAEFDQKRNLRELPMKREVGAKICKDVDSTTYQGFTENVSKDNGKLQVRVVAAYSNRYPVSFQPEVTWDKPENWYLCGE